MLIQNIQDDLVINSVAPTWMDSLDRTGAAIEIQALRLNMYSWAERLADRAKNLKFYQNLEVKMRYRIYERFWNKEQLADRIDLNDKTDFTIRPNIFLAAYIYPKLLNQQDWEKVFDRALAALWLDWGGLSTLDKNDARFLRKIRA